MQGFSDFRPTVSPVAVVITWVLGYHAFRWETKLHGNACQFGRHSVLAVPRTNTMIPYMPRRVCLISRWTGVMLAFMASSNRSRCPIKPFKHWICTHIVYIVHIYAKSYLYICILHIFDILTMVHFSWGCNWEFSWEFPMAHFSWGCIIPGFASCCYCSKSIQRQTKGSRCTSLLLFLCWKSTWIVASPWKRPHVLSAESILKIWIL